MATGPARANGIGSAFPPVDTNGAVPPGRGWHDWGDRLIIGAADLAESTGAAIALHIARSGGTRLFVERLRDGRLRAQAAPFLSPGEIVLQPGERFETPAAYAAMTEAGLGDLSRRLHARARTIAPRRRSERTPLPVHFNSWEAAYFDIDEAKAVALAEAAADIGAERFVLDDGWFRGRTSDAAGLGDWSPDPARFPHGLAPLIDRAQALGLSFGLWFEPEMANADSDLLRANPDWVVHAPDAPQPTGRQQLVLDVSRTDVRDYLFDAVNAILSAHRVDYVKWDCNRDLFPAATSAGPIGTAYAEGLHTLWSRLAAAHPDVAFESCASGGGRMDFSVLAYAGRFWPSDMTDALERVRIQRSASLFFPLETLGAHVGASPNHLTQRRFTMAFRCLVALFGHFGVELDPRALDDADRATLRNAIRVYKSLRNDICDGALYRFDDEPGRDIQTILSPDGARAILRVLQLEARPADEPLRLKPSGRAPRRLAAIRDLA